MQAVIGRCLLAGVSLGLAAGCSGASTPPGSPTPTANGGRTVSGTVVRVIDGTPIASATIRSGDHWVVSSSTGSFALAADEPISVFALGYLKREFTLAAGRSGLVIELIPEDLPFSLNFYRLFVRNGYEAPAALQPVRRWTMAPSFYIKTTIEETGAAVRADIVAAISTILARSVPELSGGRFSVGAIETGPGPRAQRSGWVSVLFQRDLPVFGNATVGGPTGVIRLRYDPDNPLLLPNNPDGCFAGVLGIAEHEVTHTMGFYHTTEVDVFNSILDGSCNGAPRSEKARYHAAIAYSRPPGNTDVDVDPIDAVTSLAPGGVDFQPTVSCTTDPVRGVR